MGAQNFCYERPCKFYEGQERRTKIRWYRAAPGAKVFKGWSCFGATLWDDAHNKASDPWGPPPPVGEDFTRRRKFLYPALPPYPDLDGSHICGTPEDFQGLSPCPDWLKDPNSTYWPALVPCVVRPALGLTGGLEPPPPLQGFLGLGGGLVLPVPVRGILGLLGGKAVPGIWGGLRLGGAAAVRAAWYPLPAGGLLAGGSAVVSTARAVALAGGALATGNVASMRGTVIATTGGALAGGTVVPAALPGLPTGLTVGSATGTSLTASWTAGAGSVNTTVWYGTSPAGPWTLLGTTGATTWTLAGLSSGTTYYVILSSRSSGGITSPYTIAVGATTLSPAGTATGGILASGMAATVAAHPVQATGGLLAGGMVAGSVGHLETAATGGVRTGGMGATAHGTTVTPAAGILAAGTVASERGLYETAAGGDRATGGVASATGHAAAVSGGVRIGGTVVSVVGHVETPATGGARVGAVGTGARGATGTTGGGVKTGSTVTETHGLVVAPAGAAKVGGTVVSTVAHAFAAAPSGGSKAGGAVASAVAHTFAAAPAGGVKSGGAVAAVVGHAAAPAGGAKAGGATAEALGYGLGLGDDDMQVGGIKASAPGGGSTLAVSWKWAFMTASGTPLVDGAGSSAVTVNITTSGAYGLDTGAVAANTWYHLWVIGGTSVSPVPILSLSATAPTTYPSGYAYCAYAGAVRTDSLKKIQQFQQFGNRVFIPPANVFTSTAGPASYTSQSVATLVPSTATVLAGMFGQATDNDWEIQVAGDTSGTGACVCKGYSSTVGNSPYRGSGENYRIPLVTAQTFYWRGGNTGAYFRADVCGWEY